MKWLAIKGLIRQGDYCVGVSIKHNQYPADNDDDVDDSNRKQKEHKMPMSMKT